MARDGVCPWACNITQGVDHGVGEARMAARAPAKMHDCVVVPNRRDRLDDFRRRISREFVVERPPDTRVASQSERNRRRAAVRGRAVEEALVKPIGGNVRPGPEDEGCPAHRGVLMVEKRADERSGQGKPGDAAARDAAGSSEAGSSEAGSSEAGKPLAQLRR